MKKLKMKDKGHAKEKNGRGKGSTMETIYLHLDLFHSRLFLFIYCLFLLFFVTFFLKKCSESFRKTKYVVYKSA